MTLPRLAEATTFSQPSLPGDDEAFGLEGLGIDLS
jgi:hypothetical protein